MHPSFWDLLSNRPLWAALLGWFLAQLLKVPIYRLVDKKWDWKRFHGSGGMPSSHTAFVVALSLMIGITESFGSAAFAISFTLSAIVMYDATGVRRETGTQAQVINEILRNVFVDGKPISEDNLKELVGHKPIEVAAGFAVGVLAALPFML